jgi:polo-like kinase 1
MSNQNNQPGTQGTGEVMDMQSTIVEEKIIKVTGDVQVRKYVKGRLLGKGGFATCFEFTCNETKKVHAAKVVTKSSLVKSRAKQKLISEIKIHKSLHHPMIVSFEHYFEDTENVYILLEMCQNQSLNELLKRRKRLTEIETQCYLVQLIKALKYLHSHRVIHRDLKLGNLFLTDKMELKVGDFGLATKLEFEGERKRTVCGTPNYIAPEILDGKTGHSYEVDIWSLGVICYTLIIGKPPFETQDVKTTYKKIKMNSYSFPEGAVISEAGRSLITEILNTDPLKRPSLDQILAHDFFNQGTSIPKLLPTSTLACTPSLSYIRQFMPEAGSNGIVQKSVSNTQRIQTTESQVQGTNTNVNVNKLLTDRTKQTTNTSGTNTQDNAMMQTGSRPLTTTTTTNGTNYMSTKGRADSISTGIKDGSNKNLNFHSNTLRSDLNNNEKKSNMTDYSPTPNNLQGPDTWVKKWVDYSSKYGLGYLLSNGSTGVFFNDSSKIVLDIKGHNFNYIERRVSDKQEIISSHTLSDYPKELQKKVTLLQHFKSYLDGDNSSSTTKDNVVTNLDTKLPPPKNLPTMNEEENKANESSRKSNNNFIYVKKWMRTRHAIMFRLSNKIVQVCFQDHTEIILSSESRVVTYANKKGERSTYPLSSALESNNYEMTKRLKYTKDILTHMLTLNTQNNAGKGTSSNVMTNDPLKDEK